MVDYLIYGKIIIDDIRLSTGEFKRGILGGGGPQGAFGARIWDPSIGLLTRSGVDIDPVSLSTLNSLDVDLSGWVKFPQHPTPHGIMAYDKNEYMIFEEGSEKRHSYFKKAMEEILDEVIPIPENYRCPKVIHLITEFPDEKMVRDALDMKSKGSIFSIEPLIDYHSWSNKEAMLNLFTEVDILTPDWPSASGFAGTDVPVDVLKHWSKFGPSLISIRHGVKGSYVWDKFNDHMYHIPIVTTNSVDPTGCGNAYGGGLCVGWEKHRDARFAGCCATVSASYMARSIGIPDFSSVPATEPPHLFEELLEQVIII